jgi:hypothetical protein
MKIRHGEERMLSFPHARQLFSSARKWIFRQDEIIEAKLRKTAKGGPKGERSESIKRIHRNPLGVLDASQVGSLSKCKQLILCALCVLFGQFH